MFDIEIDADGGRTCESKSISYRAYACKMKTSSAMAYKGSNLARDELFLLQNCQVEEL